MNARVPIYIVDDHPVFRHGLKQMIQADPSFEIVGEAGDDATAVKEIQGLKPALVVVDVRLPERGGLELVKTLRALRPSPACVVLTMHGEEATFNAAMDAGARGYILKGDSMDMVLLGLKAVAAGSVYLSPEISGWIIRRQERTSALRQKKTGLTALTPTERQVLLLVAENKTNKEIAQDLFISHRTVEAHRANICQKLELQGVHKLLQFAIENRSQL